MSRLASEPLARTFGVIGLCVAVLVATLDPPRDVQLSGVVCAIGGASLAGWIIGRLRSAQNVFFVCAIVGWFLALFAVPYWVAIGGGFRAVPFLCGIPVVVFAIALVGRGIGRAAPLSLLDRSSRRALIASAAAIVGAIAWMTIHVGTNEAFVPLIMVAGALGTAFVMAVADLRALFAVRRERAMLDFGAGEQRIERREEVPASYRTTAVVVRVEHGSRPHALRWLSRAIAVELVAVTIATTAFTCAARDAMAIEPPRPTHPGVVAVYASDPIKTPRPCVSAKRR